jgi:hypothetical protein
MLVSVLRSANVQITGETFDHIQCPKFPLEVGTNTCALLGQIRKNTSSEAMVSIKEATGTILEGLVKGTQGAQGREAVLGVAAQRTLEAWAG